MKPLVSIVVPAWNAGRWLEETLNSALGQTWPAIEIIVVDDGSTDDTLDIARRFESPRVRVVTQVNAGASAARNHGLRLAQGDYIQFLDADDLLAPDKIAAQMVRFQSGPMSVLSAGPWARFSTDPSAAIVTPEENWRDLPSAEWLCLNFSGKGMMPPAAWLCARALLERAGPWNETLSLNDDGEYFSRVIAVSDGVIFCAGALSYYRSGLPGSLSRTRSRRAWDSAFRSQLASASHLLTLEDSDRTRRACANLFIRLARAMYPDCRDIVAACERQASDHGGSDLEPEGGRGFRLASRFIGWKLTRRLQVIANRRPI